MCKDGAIVWAHVAATVVNNAAGEASRFLAVIQDVSQRKLAEAELQKVNEELENRVKARTADVMRVIAELSKQVSETDRLQTQLLQAQKMEMAGGIAHDFNNLLNIISGYAAMIPENLTDPRKISEDIEVIHETVQRGGRLIQQLLAMTRKTDSKLEPVEINSMLRKLQILLRDTFPRTIDISLQLEPELPTILADPNQMNQVLLNLCVNARDAMPDGGELLLATATIGGAELRACFQDAEAERYACVKVTDTGPGIDPNTRNRIFEPFFTTKEQGRGTGLGLSVVYGIVGNHGGFVDVASEPGHGSTFSVYLPIPKGLSKGVENMEQGGNGNLENFTGNGETILVVEDEIRELQLLRNFLEGKGYRVLTAKDGIEAVETHLQHQNEIALVVLDLGLPKMNGWNAFKEMKKMDPHLNAIIATGHMPPQIQGEIAREMTDVVMKPYQLDRVLTTISQVIGKTETETKASPDL